MASARCPALPAASQGPRAHETLSSGRGPFRALDRSALANKLSYFVDALVDALQGAGCLVVGVVPRRDEASATARALRLLDYLDAFWEGNAPLQRALRGACERHQVLADLLEPAPDAQTGTAQYAGTLYDPEQSP